MDPAQNITLPAGWTDHGTKGLICKPAEFVDIAAFFLTNYVAHLFSLKWYPAETAKERVVAMVTALFYPAFGLLRAFEFIRHRCTGGVQTLWRPRDELERAQNAEALCMVVRSEDWRPVEGEQITNVKTTKTLMSQKPLVAEGRVNNVDLEMGGYQRLEDESNEEVSYLDTSGDGAHAEKKVSRFGVYEPPWYNLRETSTSRINETVKARKCDIHGSYKLPKGYELAYVPRVAKLKRISTPLVTSRVSSSDGWANGLISIYQICASTVTLYRARGDQISRYGYSSFGLTVIPYILMTIINLISRILERDYATLYMIRSPEMKEAELRGGYFEGTVGELEPASATNEPYMGLATFEVTSVRTERNKGIEIDTYTFLNASTREPVKVTGFWIDISTDLYKVPCCSPFDAKLGASIDPVHGYWRFPDKPGHSFSTRAMLIPFTLVVLVVAIYAGLSRFRSGSESSTIQRGFIMSWIILGSYGGWVGPIFHTYESMLSWVKREADGEIFGWILFLGLTLIPLVAVSAFLVPAIGGMVMVGLMIKDFGQCTRI